MEIVRIKDSNHTIINYTAFLDKRLDAKTRGIYSTVMTLPDNWDFSINGLVSILPDGRSSIMTSIRKLKELGYCSVSREYINGKVSKFKYTFYEEPQQELLVKNLLVENQLVENVLIENQTQSNNNNIINNTNNHISSSLHSEDYSIADATEDVLTAKELNDFVFYWNSKLPLLKISKFTEVRKQKLRVRLKEVTDSTPTDTLRLLVDNVANSSFLQGDNNRGFKGTIDWVIKNESNFTKVLEGRYNDATKETATTSKPSSSYDSRESREAEHARLRERIQARLLGGMGTPPV